MQVLEIGLLVGAAVVFIVTTILVAMRGGVQVHEREFQEYEARTGSTLPPRMFMPRLFPNNNLSQLIHTDTAGR